MCSKISVNDEAPYTYPSRSASYLHICSCQMCKANSSLVTSPPFPPQKKIHLGAEKEMIAGQFIIRDRFHHITTRYRITTPYDLLSFPMWPICQRTAVIRDPDGQLSPASKQDCTHHEYSIQTGFLSFSHSRETP